MVFVSFDVSYFIDLHLLDHTCDPGMNRSYSWYMISLCIVGFGLLIFVENFSVFISDIDL